MHFQCIFSLNIYRFAVAINVSELSFGLSVSVCVKQRRCQHAANKPEVQFAVTTQKAIAGLT